MQRLVEKFSKSLPKWDTGIDSGLISRMYHFSIKAGRLAVYRIRELSDCELLEGGVCDLRPLLYFWLIIGAHELLWHSCLTRARRELRDGETSV